MDCKRLLQRVRLIEFPLKVFSSDPSFVGMTTQKRTIAIRKTILRLANLLLPDSGMKAGNETQLFHLSFQFTSAETHQH